MADKTVIKPRLLVVGSINADLTWRVEELPVPGQTVLAKAAHRSFGGKGANQAVAAARMGAEVAFCGAVGDDPAGRDYLAHFLDEGIDTSHVEVLQEVNTGTAHIYVDDHGENMIVVNSGANLAISPEAVTSALSRERGRFDAVVAQLECPVAVVVALLRWAGERRVPSILNASPYRADFPWGDVAINTVVLNEIECQDYFSVSVDDLRPRSSQERAAFLKKLRVEHLVVTQGARSTVFISEKEVLDVRTYPVTPVDTVGAGDTFAGALAALRGEGAEWGSALWRANVAAALSTQRNGAQTAMPRRAGVEACAGAGGIAPGLGRREVT